MEPEVLQTGLGIIFLNHIVDLQNKGEKKQWLLMEHTGRENDSSFSNLG